MRHMVKRRKKCKVEIGWKELRRRRRRYQMLGFQMGAVLAGEVLPGKENTLKKRKYMYDRVCSSKVNISVSFQSFVGQL